MKAKYIGKNNLAEDMKILQSFYRPGRDHSRDKRGPQAL